MSSESEFLSAHENIKLSYKAVQRQIEAATAHEEHKRHSEAIASYKACLQAIEEIFNIPVGLPDDIDAVQAEWTEACALIQDLKATKTDISYRLKVLQNKHRPLDNEAEEANEIDNSLAEGRSAVDGDEPQPKKKSTPLLLENPTTHYDISTNGMATPKTYKEIITALRNVMGDENSEVLLDTLFEAQAKLYKIQPNGEVSTLTKDETHMSLVMVTVGGEYQFLNGIFYIQFEIPQKMLENAASSSKAAKQLQGEHLIWLYPLVPNVTSCYRTNYGAFIFPDMESQIAGNAFGIMLCEEASSTLLEPSELQQEAADVEQLTDLQQFFLDLLEAVLAGKVEALQQPIGSRMPRDTSQKVSKHIVQAADFIARNLVKGAEKTGELMVKSTPYIISKLNPAAPDAPEVSPTVQNSVEVAKGVTSMAADVTGWVAAKVGSATMAIGRFLAPHIQSGGAVILEKGLGYDVDEANSTMEGALTIAAGAVEGLSTVVQGLEKSAVILGTNLSGNSVKIIEHKYGNSAGNLAAGTFDTIGNAFHVSQNVHVFSARGLAKKMAKNTGKALVIEHRAGLRMKNHVVLAGALYPDLRSLKDFKD